MYAGALSVLVRIEWKSAVMCGEPAAKGMCSWPAPL